ncbi:hypothetical protein HS088_TW02G01020 [Tripterygium wilfordii]|uniref:J domain-containing protein n=1 Tax=Tripterygium wilfordii TaxID=458696 RepID=A0A7J7E0E3_TRIWF|nr:dentin sialophosphoprotein-like [Tripterygium wilfordii]XP_038718527.1 dentin sialophosphoprotein-like [Tripterygium wilfordii]KAF5752001.1 hypothetical protein HS088_TW02G01020 [Tripterygium wilfordii]
MTEGVSRGQNRACFRKNRLKSCGLNGNLDNVVLIDVDSDGLNDVIVIDAPEAEGLQQQCEGSRIHREVKRNPFGSIISIDDDDGDDVDQPGGNMESGGDSDATSRKSCPVFSHMQNSVDLDNDECRVIREKKSEFKLWKCQKSYTWKTQFRNRYGLNNDSKSDPSDSDSSDCEFMEGSTGKLREQWEKASIRRKGNDCDGNLGFDGQASSSASHGNIHPNVNVENEYEKHSEEPPCTSSSSTDFEKGFFTSFGPTVDDASLDTHMESDQKINQDGCGKDDVCLNGETCIGTNLSTFVPQNDDGCGAGCDSSGHDEQQHSPRLSSQPNGQHGDRQDNHSKAFHLDRMGNTVGEHSFSNSQLRPNAHSDNFKDSLQEEHVEDFPLCNEQDSHETENIHHERDKLGKSNEFFKGIPVSGEQLVSNAQPSDRTSFTKVLSPSGEKVRAIPEESISNGHLCETQNQQGKPSSTESKHSSIGSTYTNKLCHGKGTFHTQGGDFIPAAPIDIINEREKLKETDEYKRVVEEEWASRHRQLQIQAEEAQRLRKRKKAESMRLLDMQRRQKQRVEEVRETQKKDEENLNLKEKFRAEVRNELGKLEKMCIDMASLLRGLGIHVPGGPSLHEVNAAYKQALLRFHPDRASRTDIRQQVEAEEKFKLVSRMKEKLSMTSCH